MSVRTPRDVELSRGKPPSSGVLTIQATRCIVAGLTALGKATDARAVAEATGYSEWQVNQILNSPQYEELLAEEARRVVAPLIVQNLRHFGVAAQDEDLPLGQRIKLNTELRQTWESLNKLSPIQNRDERAAAALSALESIRARRAVVQVQEPKPESESA